MTTEQILFTSFSKSGDTEITKIGDGKYMLKYNVGADTTYLRMYAPTIVNSSTIQFTCEKNKETVKITPDKVYLNNGKVTLSVNAEYKLYTSVGFDNLMKHLRGISSSSGKTSGNNSSGSKPSTTKPATTASKSNSTTTKPAITPAPAQQDNRPCTATVTNPRYIIKEPGSGYVFPFHMFYEVVTSRPVRRFDYLYVQNVDTQQLYKDPITGKPYFEQTGSDEPLLTFILEDEKMPKATPSKPLRLKMWIFMSTPGIDKWIGKFSTPVYIWDGTYLRRE